MPSLLSDIERLNLLTYPTGKVRMVLDTDTYNEIDDQFALTYALLSQDRLQLEAIYAAPFFNELSSGPADGMEKSYQEIHRLLSHLSTAGEGQAGDAQSLSLVETFRGSTSYLPSKTTPVESDAARDLVNKAKASSREDPLYVVAIGAITNVASAILMQPEIIQNIVVIWLGGHALHWRDTREFNLIQDVHAARVVLDCGVPLVLVPCHGVASHLHTTLVEIEAYVKGRGDIGNYLYEVFQNCSTDHYAYSRVIWDVSTVAYLVNQEWVPTSVIHSPVLNDGGTWSVDTSRHLIRCANFVHRDPIFRDLFEKIARYAK